MRWSRWRRAVGVGVALAAIVAAFALMIARSESLPAGPEAIVWDRTACAECRMAVSEPRFAAQLQTKDGRVLDFDDPGCLFLYLDANPEVETHAIYFRHHREDRWIPAERAAFVSVGPSPMAFDLGAEDRGVEGGLTVDAARESVRERESRGCCSHD